MSAVVFSGHMVDAPDRAVPRFPPARVPAVRIELAAAVAAVDDVGAVGISGLACGGDLIFCELWLATGRRLHGYLPRREEAFLDESVRIGGDEWVWAYQRVMNHPGTTIFGPTGEMSDAHDPHTPNNLRMLAAAQNAGRPMRAIVLWNGEGGDGPGGTGHLVSEVEIQGGRVAIIAP